MTSPCQMAVRARVRRARLRRSAVRCATSIARFGSARIPADKRAGDRRLLDDLDAADLADQRLQPAALDPRLLQEIAQIVAGALPAVMLGEDRVAQRRVDAIGFERRIVLQIDRLGIAALQPVERRLGDVEKAPCRSARHLAEEEGQQQRADMAAVDIGVGHDDDAVIARLLRSKSSLPMPVPSAAIRVPISAEPSILSKRARSTLRILPFKRQDRLEARGRGPAWPSRRRCRPRR